MTRPIDEQDELAEGRDLEYHGKNHGPAGRDKVLHPLLGGLHTGTEALGQTPQLGDVIVAQGTPPEWERYGLVVPAANQRNALAVDNAETVPTWQGLFAADLPTTITPGSAGSAGTGIDAARDTHDHPAPATYPPTAHAVLGPSHSDAATQGATRGSLIVADATPAWNELTVGSAESMLWTDGTDVSWHTGAWTAVAHGDVTFNAATGTWTVASGDMVTYAYRLLGKTMIVAFRFLATTTSLATATLTVSIPATRTANRTITNLCLIDENGTSTAGYAQVTAAGTVITFGKIPIANIAALTDLVSVVGEITFEVQ